MLPSPWLRGEIVAVKRTLPEVVHGIFATARSGSRGRAFEATEPAH